jgi:hypothetical protein
MYNGALVAGAKIDFPAVLLVSQPILGFAQASPQNHASSASVVFLSHMVRLAQLHALFTHRKKS